MKENLYTPNSIRTVSGRYVDLKHPQEETLHIEDIAHALAHTPRFGGHLPFFYSVAEHSLAVVEKVPNRYKLQALLHDASEAYLCDVPSPLKQLLPEYKELEAQMMRVMAKRFGFDPVVNAVVKVADEAQLELEWHELMLCESSLQSKHVWHRVKPWTHSNMNAVATMFLAAFKDLYYLTHGQQWADATLNKTRA